MKHLDKRETLWKDIDWKIVEREVFKLQVRIYKASQRGDVESVYNLQRLLTKSYYGRLWATRRVTQDNQGKDTAGVDGKKSYTPSQRFELVEELKLISKAKPLRRVWIPKSDGTKRGLGIPTIFDRALQCLVKQAIEPEWEARFEDNSYGFRPARGCHDAIDAIFNAIKQKAKYVLNADIIKCFDQISHSKLLEKLNTYPELRNQIKHWLKSGVINDGIFENTTEGTPQGGVISPILANIALHGMELEMKKYARSLKGNKWKNEFALSLIRYADNFVILHEELEVIEDCQRVIENWLNEIGLELKPSKTHISHTLKEIDGKIGLDFLGFNIRQYPVGKCNSGKNTHGVKLGFKTIIKPSKERVKAHIKKIGDIIRSHKSAPQEALISKLNPIISGWSNYYSTVCSKETFSYCDHIVYQQLKRWAERRHPKKNKTWVKEKYWKSTNNRNWVFTPTIEGNIKLKHHADTSIKRHIKVKGNKSIFDGDSKYWSTRMGRNPLLSNRKASLLKKQKGKCKLCNALFKEGDLLEIDHTIPTANGGKDTYDNLQLLHRHCHDKKTAQDIKDICSKKSK